MPRIRTHSRAPLPPIRARANMPSVGTGYDQRKILGEKPLLQPGTKEYDEELLGQRQETMERIRQNAARSSEFLKLSSNQENPFNPIMTYSKPQTSKEIKAGKEPTLVEVHSPAATAVARAVSGLFERQYTNGLLRTSGLKTLPAHTRDKSPTPFPAERSPSPVVTRRPTLDGQPPVKPLPAHPPEGRYTLPETRESTFRWICNKISCGLFNSRRKRKGKGGRRTIRRRRQTQRSR